MQDSFLRVDEVIALTKLSQSTLYRLEQQGQFPPRIKLSERAVAWREEDVRAWMAARENKTKKEEVGQ